MIERILDLMKERGVNATKLTADTGIASNSITEWKNNRAKPGTDAIIKIADYFGVTTDYLLGKSNIPTPPTPDIAAILEENARLKAENAKKDQQITVIKTVLDQDRKTEDLLQDISSHLYTKQPEYTTQ